MEIQIDPDRCMGHGQCETFGPDLFVVGDDGLATVRIARPAAGLHTRARDAAERCPEGAISLREG